MSTGVLPGASRVPTRRRPRVIVVAIVVVLLAAGLLQVTRFTADARLARWTAQCEARGGAVRTLPVENSNPLLVQSPDAAYECRAVGNRLLGTWR